MRFAKEFVTSKEGVRLFLATGRADDRGFRAQQVLNFGGGRVCPEELGGRPTVALSV